MPQQNKSHVVITDPPPGFQPAPPPAAASHPVHASRPAVAPIDLAGELERLSKLRAGGQLPPEEYEAAKRKLLA